MLPPTLDAALELLKGAVPGLHAVYLYGSHAAGTARPDSDVDVAVLAARPLSALLRWQVQQTLAVRLGRDVDLVDLRTTSTVLQAQILGSSRLVLDASPPARHAFEMHALAAYALLNEERAAILDDIRARGRVYG